MVSRAGVITTLAGGGTAVAVRSQPGDFRAGTRGLDLAFEAVGGVAVDAQGRVYVSDAAQQSVVRLGSDGSAALIVVGGGSGRIAADPRSGELYALDGLVVIRYVAPA
jgi:hypothetical protein